jgi:hypothetical protein
VCESCEFFNNGQTTIDRTIQIVEDAIKKAHGQTGILAPVALMLLDFQMP